MPIISYINYNGKIMPASQAAVPVHNGAFRYGYGLFETMLVENNVIRLVEYHFDRLFSGLSQLYLHLPKQVTADFLLQHILKTVAKNGLGHLCRVRLQVFACGNGLYSSDSQASFIVECFPLEPSAIRFNENGLVTGLASGLSKSMDSLSNLKSCNALIYAQAARQAMNNKWNDALISNTAGNVIESTMANIFWIKDSHVYTPPLSEGCVAGVMRRFLLTMGMGISEKSLEPGELMQADEAFLTNAIKGIKWIGSIGNKKFENKRTRAIHDGIFR